MQPTVSNFVRSGPSGSCQVGNVTTETSVQVWAMAPGLLGSGIQKVVGSRTGPGYVALDFAGNGFPDPWPVWIYAFGQCGEEVGHSYMTLGPLPVLPIQKRVIPRLAPEVVRR